MKKWIAVICAVTLGFSVTGCGQKNEGVVKQLLSEKLSGEITVSCYDTMLYKDFLEKAAKTFEKKNPGTKIKVESFAPMPEIKELEGGGSIVSTSKEDDEQKRADYVSKINTELMSGKGADVLAMDILPYYKYADGGQLEDLQLYMDADSSFNIKDYQKNILDAMKYHDGQYIMPLDYMFDYLAYDASLFNENEKQSLQKSDKYTYKKLFDIGKEPLQRANTDATEPVRMFDRFAGTDMVREMLRTDYKNYIDIENKKVNLIDGKFAGLLESVKKYGENGYLDIEPNYKELSVEDLEKMDRQHFVFKTKMDTSLIDEALKSAGINSNGPVSDGGDTSNDKSLGSLTNDNGEAQFRYMQAYGINSNSQNKALAWAFLKFLMSGDIPLESYSFPIKNTARMDMIKLYISGQLFDGKADPNKELTAEQKKAYETSTKSIEKFSDALNYYPIKDDTIDTMIEKEVDNYFNGSKTADEVANTLQEKIELYLNE
ncbi:ABC transporter substrate-binding protein [Aminipila sp.]|uniref:ABC transporter substrate-binding protein n=1 Tax=Aminipila sp. TaxID=2060095 RepID=UPI0028986DF1|nr:extracellular solute-binding protein [Aminipila sp.]